MEAITGKREKAMKKTFSVIILSILLVFNANILILAAKTNVRATIERRTILNNITDSLATIGKSKRKKITIKRARWLARRKARLRKIREQNRKNNRRR